MDPAAVILIDSCRNTESFLNSRLENPLLFKVLIGLVSPSHHFETKHYRIYERFLPSLFP